MGNIHEARYQARVPRYTSYPTAAQFHGGVNASHYEDWLRDLARRSEPSSIYVHVPFCRSLCWFCACHTRAVRDDPPIERYTDSLHREIDLVASRVRDRLSVRHVHLGGGTPTVLSEAAMERLAEHLRERFNVTPDAEFAVEVDPRTLTPDKARALQRCGVNRVSLGVQDLHPVVQRAIHRWQPLRQVSDAVQWLHAAGIRALNIDLMYGLPHQSVDSIADTAASIAALRPQRIALFGYAHVPWFKRNQKAIDVASLPDANARLAQYWCASNVLVEQGYAAIGLDHFALPGDGLARAQHAGALHRNFQGYTTDAASTLVGFGASAIGQLPQGFVQNTARESTYRDQIAADRLPVARGLAIGVEDRLRWTIIERLMCDLQVDLASVCTAHGVELDKFASEIDSLESLQEEGLVEVRGALVSIPTDARPLMRNVCAVFDRYLPPIENVRKHSMAV